jgi:4-amino-4-deoxy-L-arabinose transferase-like glycosyltransferase
MALAAILNLWALSRNGWANDYYSAAVRSMSSSWHNFLFASLDQSGVMTVDKPPLALWVQALSVRVFGFHSLSILVPQALMGVASVALVYDLVRRRFGRVGGFVAAIALALTPITVGISRHNNPDALLVLCSVAAVWCVVRAFDAAPAGRGARWLALAGVAVGLGFETKMGVALTVVPGIAAAWLWISPAGRGRLHALGQLLSGGLVMVLVGGAWPALVELTPAADRPWISGTADNRVLSLIFEYNGLGRVDGQTGGPGASGGNMFGGTPGLLRLLNSALGGQVGWLLGFALVSGLGILLATRLRRSDARSGWLIVIGATFVTTAILFSAASGIFHPYYVSLLAPFAAALIGAGAAQMIGGSLNARILAPLAVLAGAASELVVRAEYPGQLGWLPAVLVVVCGLAVLALAAFGSPVIRRVALTAALAALLAAPTVWAFDTLGYATNGTFPSGGPASALASGFAGARRGGFGARGAPPGGLGASGAAGAQALFGTASASATPSAPTGVPPGPGGVTPRAGRFTGAPPAGASAAGGAAAPGGAGGPGGAFGGGEQSLREVLSYVSAHGGGTIAVGSQSSAASAILSEHADVAGIGGFSGRESDVSVSWLAHEVSSGRIRWVLDEPTGGGAGGRLPGDTRTGSKAAMAAVAKACTSVALPTSAAATTAAGSAAATSGTSAGSGASLYDCNGAAAALLSGSSTQQSER